jgi:hypothetical protein
MLTGVKKHLDIDDLEQRGINHDRDWFSCRLTEYYQRSNLFDQTWWCEDHISGRYHRYGREFWFEYESDRTLFLLKWSGQ